jgi:hypothetical protein
MEMKEMDMDGDTRTAPGLYLLFAWTDEIRGDAPADTIRGIYPSLLDAEAAGTAFRLNMLADQFNDLVEDDAEADPEELEEPYENMQIVRLVEPTADKPGTLEFAADFVDWGKELPHWNDYLGPNRHKRAPEIVQPEAYTAEQLMEAYEVAQIAYAEAHPDE